MALIRYNRDMANRKAQIMKGIVLGLGLTAGLAVAVIAPNLFAVLGQLHSSTKKYKPAQLKRSLQNLKEKNLVSISQEGSKTVVRLTKNGKQKLLKYKLEELKIKPTTKWDRKWRMVIFDIPKAFKKNSDFFSLKLRQMGFLLLQKSVWVCPYPCEDEIDFIKEIYQIRPFVRVVTADRIDIQHDLIKRFNLT